MTIERISERYSDILSTSFFEMIRSFCAKDFGLCHYERGVNLSHSMINEEKIYHILRELIFNAELPPGQQLKESSLAKHLVSAGHRSVPFYSALSMIL
ncbi:hypothetical protein QS257_20930 [Terrilactibacillus sp. S3-3]|nr:hypothetical protein QS257_20930 [Terrilactibacillus sp. S3-3]